MTDIAELKARSDKLSQIADDARAEAQVARDQYRAAILDEFISDMKAQGISEGTVVDAFYGDTLKGRSVVVGFKISRYLDKGVPILAKLKKDGTPSKMEAHLFYDRLKPAST